MFLKRKQSFLIKKFYFPIVHREVVKDSSGPWDNEVESFNFIKDVAEACTLHPIKQDNVSVLTEGVKKDNAYVLITNSPMWAQEDGQDFMGTSLYIPNNFFNTAPTRLPIPNKGGWYRVIMSKPWQNGVRNNYEVLIEKDTTAEDDEGNNKYPDTSSVNSLSNSDLKGNSWEAAWLA